MHSIGIDVSKARLDVAVRRPDDRRWYTRKRANTPAGVRELVADVCHKLQAQPQALRVVMEATGPYHQQALHTLHELGCTVCLANPKQVRDYAKSMGLLTKTDAADARALARYGAHKHLRPWTPPPPEIQTLTGLLRRVQALEQDQRRETNRLEKIQASGHAPPAVYDSLARSLQAYRQEIQRLRHEIQAHIARHPRLKQDQALLTSIPGIGHTTAQQLLCLLHGQTYRSARQAAAHAGLAVRLHQSGSSVHRPARLTKQGHSTLRAKLYMAALVAKQHNPALKTFYERLLHRRKAPMAALGAIMRKLVHIAYGVLKSQTPFDPALAAANT